MSTTPSRRAYESSTAGAWAIGGAAFAGVMLATVAIFQILQGIAAIADDEMYVSGIKYVYQIDLTTWGWVHLVLGIVGLTAGIGILANKAWANVIGIVLATLGAISSFAFLPYFPFWSLVIIAFDVFIIWALCSNLTHD